MWDCILRTATNWVWFYLDRFLQMRTPKIRSRFLIPTIQAIFLLYACLCSVSRITDHRHHWWDVLAGANIGIIFASLVVNDKYNHIFPRIEITTLTSRDVSVDRLSTHCSAFLSFQCTFMCKNFQVKKVPNVEPMLQNGNTVDHRHTSVRRLLSERTKDDLNLSHVVVP